MRIFACAKSYYECCAYALVAGCACSYVEIAAPERLYLDMLVLRHITTVVPKLLSLDVHGLGDIKTDVLLNWPCPVYCLIAKLNC